MDGFDSQLIELIEHQNNILISIYSFVAFGFILLVCGFVIYLFLKPLWFFLKKY